MIKNYFKTAWRNMQRNKIYAAINIIGLAIGLAVCMLIVLYVGHEYSFDKFHTNAERIYSIGGMDKIGNDSTFMSYMSYCTAPQVKQVDADVESFIRLRSEENTIIQNQKSPALKFKEDNFLFADSNFFSFFSFKLSKGNKEQVLKQPFNVVITKKAAQKYFGDTDPIGKTLQYNNKYNLIVTGVADNPPSNSSIQFDFVASLSSLTSIDDEKGLTQSQIVQFGAFSTYFLLKEPDDRQKLEKTISQLHKNASKDLQSDEKYIATPLIAIHLDANYYDSANIKYLRVFPFIALLILLLALINYTSLSTARSTVRAKEIGVRKVMGASRNIIATQFFIESALYTAIAFVIGYLICSLFQPLFFNLLQIDLNKSFLYSHYVILPFIALFFITSFLAAIYPSILLSAYKPVAVLYGKFSKQRSGLSIRKFFTVFQFAIAVILIICVIVMDKQMYFFRHSETGVDRENILMVPFSSSIGNNYTSFKNQTESLAAVQEVGTAHYPMYKGYDQFFAKTKTTNQDVVLPILSVDKNFISMLGLKWEIVPEDSFYYKKNNVAIINETAITKLNLDKNPLHETIRMANQNIEIAGVLKDFNYESLQDKIGPLCIFVSQVDTSSIWGQVGGCLFLKLKPHTNIPLTIARIKKVYSSNDHITPFQYYFLDDAFEAMYNAEDRLAKIFSAFTAFTLLIACLGLFGLATFSAEQRTKEVGIRKVLGASISSIAQLLSKDFLKLVLFASLIAFPIAWWAMNKWLQNFAYRIHIEWWVFVFATVIAILIALITVSFQAIKAALANPVENLRSE